MYDYKHVRAWGEMMGSSKLYIDGQVALARQEKAPYNAVYKRSEYSDARPNEWVTLDDVQNPDAFIRMGLPIPNRLKFYVSVRVMKYFDNPGDRDYLVNRIDEFLDSLGLNNAGRDKEKWDYLITSKNY